MKRLAASLFALFLVTTSSGCGYTLVRPGSAMPAGVRSLFVEVVGAARKDPESVDALARELRRIVRRDGRYRVRGDATSADAVLRVELGDARIEPVAFDEFDEVLDYEMTVRVRASLEDSHGKRLWSANDLGATRAHAAVPGAIVTSSSAFQASERLTASDLAVLDTVQLGEVRRQHALDALTRDLAQTIYARMTEAR